MEAAEPVTESLADFARRLDYKKSYITKLKQDGRLVMAPDGKHVMVEASIALLRQTSDPSRQGVADRHAAARSESPAPDQDDENGDVPQAPVATPEQRMFHQSRAQKEHWNALAAQRDYEVSMRQLLPAAEVDGAIADAVTQLRARLETLPDILAPQLAAEPDEAKCRALLADEIEHALQELARAFGAIAKAELH